MAQTTKAVVKLLMTDVEQTGSTGNGILIHGQYEALMAELCAENPAALKNRPK